MILTMCLYVAAEVVEHCCSITSLQLGETMPGIAKDMDTHTYRVPLGVTAGITPFNFPAMIPLWVHTNCAALLLLKLISFIYEKSYNKSYYYIKYYNV